MNLFVTFSLISESKLTEHGTSSSDSLFSTSIKAWICPNRFRQVIGTRSFLITLSFFIGCHQLMLRCYDIFDRKLVFCRIMKNLSLFSCLIPSIITLVFAKPIYNLTGDTFRSVSLSGRKKAKFSGRIKARIETEQCHLQIGGEKEVDDCSDSHKCVLTAPFWTTGNSDKNPSSKYDQKHIIFSIFWEFRKRRTVK